MLAPVTSTPLAIRRAGSVSCENARPNTEIAAAAPLVVPARSATEPSSTALMMILPEQFKGRLSSRRRAGQVIFSARGPEVELNVQAGSLAGHDQFHTARACARRMEVGANCMGAKHSRRVNTPFDRLDFSDSVRTPGVSRY